MHSRAKVLLLVTSAKIGTNIPSSFLTGDKDHGPQGTPL